MWHHIGTSVECLVTHVAGRRLLGCVCLFMCPQTGMSGACLVSVVGPDSGPLGSGSHCVPGPRSGNSGHVFDFGPVVSGAVFVLTPGLGPGCLFGPSVVSPDSGFSGSVSDSESG